MTPRPSDPPPRSELEPRSEAETQLSHQDITILRKELKESKTEIRCLKILNKKYWNSWVDSLWGLMGTTDKFAHWLISDTDCDCGDKKDCPSCQAKKWLDEGRESDE